LKALNDMTATAGCETQAYDKVTIRLHWATAVLVAIQFLIGRTTNFLPRGPLRVDIWSLHVMFGFALAVVVVAGILWRALYGRRLPPPERGVRHLVAVATHRLLDGLLLIIIGLGVTNVFAHAFPLFNLWHFPRLGDDAFMHSVNTWHGLVANIIVAVALLHAAAALFHHYVVKDGVLRRMWPAAGTSFHRKDRDDDLRA
jgi:cytochrome b561